MWTYQISDGALTLGKLIIVDPETKVGVRFSSSPEHARAWCKHLNAGGDFTGYIHDNMPPVRIRVVYDNTASDLIK